MLEHYVFLNYAINACKALLLYRNLVYQGIVPTICYRMDTVSHAVSEYFNIHTNTFPVLSPEVSGRADNLCKESIQYLNTVSKHLELKLTF